MIKERNEKKMIKKRKEESSYFSTTASLGQSFFSLHECGTSIE